MTNETRQRIEAYKKMLPDMRERVLSVAILLVMSISMMASASFAWITLSKSPEVTGMQTTVAANGNLEIALAQGLTKDPVVVPGESQIGDSSATEGKTIVDANVTWGNLVNVSDPSYGLDKIMLRPALLSEYNIKRNPLYGAAYGGDGRVVDTSNKYEFASWKEMTKDQWRFAAGSLTEYGVRAIGTVKYENVTGNATVEQFQSAVDAAYSNVNTLYAGIVSNDSSIATNISEKPGKTMTSIKALESLVTVFANDKISEMLGSGSDSSCSPYIYYFYKILLLFRDVLDAEGEALLQMANWQAYMNGGEGNTNTFANIDKLKENVNNLSNYGVTLKTLKGHMADYNNVLEAIRIIEPMALECKDPDDPNNPTYTFDDIYPAVSKLIDINEATINGAKMSTLSAGDITKLTGSSRKPVIIHKGVLKDFEQRALGINERMRANVSIKAMNIYTVNGVVTTAASGVAEKNVDYDFTAGGTFIGGTGEAVAEDTYGMAIDLWARTNYPSAVLTLEGSLIYDEIDVTGVDEEGNTVNIYVLKDDDTEADVYQKDGKWYYAVGHSEVPTELLNNNEPKQKTEQIIIGYQGENRIWEDWEDMLEWGYIEKDTTTQGAGSCYVFYADSPTEQVEILELLQAFTIAFVDQNGKTLSMATLNTENAIANQGKVTVPLEISSGVSYTGENNETHLGITTLRQNEPTWITAIVYLNGRKLNNENVLAAKEIQGQLNIQFGTNATLVAPDNEELQAQYRTITAKVTVGDKESTDKAEPIQLEYNPNGHTVNVTLEIDGEQPERIRGFFVRAINETQGTRGEEKSFTKNDDGTWSAEFVISAPGNYILNTLMVDGVQYNLHDGTTAGRPANHPAVHIEGLQLGTVFTDISSGTYMSTEKTFPVKVTAKIESKIVPRTVSAVFFNENQSKQYTALMTYDEGNDQWVGTADISESDTYTLSYISVISDTDIYTLDVPAANQTKLILYLGLSAGVYTTLDEANWNIPMRDSNGDGDTDAVTVPMYVRVWDGSGEMMDDFSNVKLYYHEGTSAMDADGLEAQLTWTEEFGGFYKGDFSIDEEGIYSANRLVVSMQGQSSPLYNLNDDAPVFTCEAFTDPAYKDSKAELYQLALTDDNPAKYVVTLSDAKTASATATFVKTDGAGETLTITSENRQANITNSALTDYIFDLDQDGTWKLTNLQVVKLGNTTNIQVDDGPETKVVATVHTETWYDGERKEFDKPVELNGDCLETQETGLVEIIATDYNGAPIKGLTGVTWTFTHDVDKVKQKAYAGYLGADGNAIKVNPWPVPADGYTIDTENATFTGSEELVYAGDYNSVVTLNFEGGQTYTLEKGNPKFVVKSDKPTVTITGVSAQHSSIRIYTTNNPSNKDNMLSGNFNTFNKYTSGSAAVYMYVATQGDGWFDQEAAIAYKPNVTMKMSGITNTGVTNAKMVFEHDAGSDYNAVFNFTVNNNEYTATGAVGGFEQGERGTTGVRRYPVFYPMGKKTVGEITLTYKNTPIVVELKNDITINNPQSPLYVDFAAAATNGLSIPTKPERIYGTPNADGEFEITLPTSQTWNVGMENNEPGTYEPLAGYPKTENVYRTWSTSGCNSKTYWVGYERTTLIEQSASKTTTWTNTYSIQKWKIGSNEYDPGATVKISANQTVTAVLGVTEGTKTTVDSVMQRTNITYVETVPQQESKPAGYDIDIGTGSTAPTNVVDEEVKIQ